MFGAYEDTIPTAPIPHSDWKMLGFTMYTPLDSLSFSIIVIVPPPLASCLRAPVIPHHLRRQKLYFCYWSADQADLALVSARHYKFPTPSNHMNRHYLQRSVTSRRHEQPFWTRMSRTMRFRWILSLAELDDRFPAIFHALSDGGALFESQKALDRKPTRSKWYGRRSNEESVKWAPKRHNISVIHKKIRG